jgi:hypothetical protein
MKCRIGVLPCVRCTFVNIILPAIVKAPAEDRSSLHESLSYVN